MDKINNINKEATLINHSFKCNSDGLKLTYTFDIPYAFMGSPERTGEALAKLLDLYLNGKIDINQAK